MPTTVQITLPIFMNTMRRKSRITPSLSSYLLVHRFDFDHSHAAAYYQFSSKYLLAARVCPNQNELNRLRESRGEGWLKATRVKQTVVDGRCKKHNALDMFARREDGRRCRVLSSSVCTQPGWWGECAMLSVCSMSMCCKCTGCASRVQTIERVAYVTLFWPPGRFVCTRSLYLSSG